MLEIVAGAALGALATLTVQWWTNRNSATRAARREMYVELLAMLERALRVWEPTTLDPDATIPDVIPDDRIDEFDARVELDASPEVRDLTRQAFALSQRFNVSYVMKVPVDVNEHGLFDYRYELVRGVDDDVAKLHRRIGLAGIRGDLRSVVDQLAAQMRRELHGKGS